MTTSRLFPFVGTDLDRQEIDRQPDVAVNGTRNRSWIRSKQGMHIIWGPTDIVEAMSLSAFLTGRKGDATEALSSCNGSRKQPSLKCQSGKNNVCRPVSGAKCLPSKGPWTWPDGRLVVLQGCRRTWGNGRDDGIYGPGGRAGSGKAVRSRRAPRDHSWRFALEGWRGRAGADDWRVGGRAPARQALWTRSRQSVSPVVQAAGRLHGAWRALGCAATES